MLDDSKSLKYLMNFVILKKEQNNFGDGFDSIADGGKVKRRRIDNGVAEIDGNKKQLNLNRRLRC